VKPRTRAGQKAAVTRAKNAIAKKRSLAALRGAAKRKLNRAMNASLKASEDGVHRYSVSYAEGKGGPTPGLETITAEKEDPTEHECRMIQVPEDAPREGKAADLSEGPRGIAAHLDALDLALDGLEAKLQRFLTPEPTEGHGGVGRSDVSGALGAAIARINELAGRVDL
jgi:hypothetical protein